MKKSTKIITAAISLLVAAAVLFIVLLNSNTSAISKESEPVLFQVEEGQVQSDVLDKLESEGIIKSAFFTKLKAKTSGYTDTYAGYFELDKSWSSVEILEYMNNRDNAAPREVTIMLVEGSWAKDMARTISQHTTASEEKLLELWNDKAYISLLMEYYDVLPVELLDNKSANVLLEGFLYPDTYTFDIEASEKEITELIISNGNRHYNDYKGKIAASGFNHYELMTLASIVEYEANTDVDMRMVAGVFMNRLRDGVKLESSVTVCYALYTFESWEDCERESPDSPYNTYRYEGLTPGPILNPSVRAIEATLDYDKNDYFFFIADVNGDGSVHYQKTYAEHEVVRKELLGY
ncbi:endolytic transglycosylase MltG [Erysipelothrix sp. HDW6C]|nr:endolytic transglycosylase MltG [Erysipelothrix sp. HDW6C]